MSHMNGFRRVINIQLLALLGALGWACGCTSDPVCPTEGTAPKIVWQDIDGRMKQALDVGDEEGLSDEQLSAKYATSRIEATVRRPTPGGNRYLLLVERSQRTQDIVIGGTNVSNVQNVLADLDSAPVLDAELGVEFHHGFYTLAQDVRTDVEPLLNKRFATNLTGYSLGGAMVAILSLQLHVHRFEVDSVVTFGQPKVTFADGAEAFADRPLLRFIAARDGIPFLFSDHPYVHFGEEVILLDGPNLVFLSPIDSNYVLSTSPAPDGLSGSLNISDHETYLARIASKLDVTINQVSFCLRDQFIVSE